VIYKGPDAEYQGHEICFNYNEDTLTIVDVTHKDAIKLLSRYGYEGSCYTHQVPFTASAMPLASLTDEDISAAQGWLNAEQTHLVLDDELDEQQYSPLEGHTRTMVWDVTKLDRPTLVSNFYSSEKSIGTRCLPLCNAESIFVIVFRCHRSQPVLAPGHELPVKLLRGLAHSGRICSWRKGSD
jgi:hypothetical protein